MPATKEQPRRKTPADFEAEQRATDRFNDMLRDDFGFDAYRICMVHEAIQQAGLELVCSDQG
ncbi:MAG: hypothetical protein ABGZ53_30325 [Fuerstiella sp.]